MRSGIVRGQKIHKAKLALVKGMRRNMTPAEMVFWKAVKGNQLGGLHFRRQQLIDGFIADFYCERLRLVVEIDGGVHESQQDYDRLRDQVIGSRGLQVLRFSNDNIINNLSSVLNLILRLHTASPYSPLPSGEGQGEVCKSEGNSNHAP